MVATRITLVRRGYHAPNTAKLQAEVAQALQRAGLYVQGTQSRYPPQQPPRNPKRKPYRRTGTYGRSSRTRVKKAAVEVTFNASRGGNTYSGYVGGHRDGPKGEKQTSEMASRGWAGLDDTTDKAVERLERDLDRILGDV